jgi:hypothetical protein
MMVGITSAQLVTAKSDGRRRSNLTRPGPAVRSLAIVATVIGGLPFTLGESDALLVILPRLQGAGSPLPICIGRRGFF